MQPQEVTQLIKQYDAMAPIMQSLAGKSVPGRMQALREMQQGGMFDPGAQLAKAKKGTGKAAARQRSERS